MKVTLYVASNAPADETVSSLGTVETPLDLRETKMLSIGGSMICGPTGESEEPEPDTEERFVEWLEERGWTRIVAEITHTFRGYGWPEE